MPYKSMEEVPASLKGIKPMPTLPQFNLIAQWAEKIEAAGGADKPWAVAIANFKKAFEVQDGKWVRKKELEAYEDGDDLFVIVAEIELEKVTKSEGKQYPASDYLVVEDPEKPTTWHLRITKIPGGSPDHAQCGAAWAALHKGYRGNKYQGPNKAEAIKKLTAIYRKNKWPLPTEAEGDEQETTLRYFGLLELDEAQTPDFARNRNKDGTPKWIPVHRLGKWSDPRYGEFDMTEVKMEQAVANFYGCIHRPESPVDAQVPVDTRHQGDPASGWLQDMRIASPYLWGKPRWTDKGRRVVLDRQYLYVSPRYLDDPQRGPIFQEVTLTNRNFLQMPPLDGEGPTVFLSDDAQIVIHRTEEVSNVDKIKLTVGGEEKELSLEEVQQLLSTGELTAKELADAKAELEKTKKSQEAPREAITLTKEDGTEVVLTASAVAGMMQDNETYRKERKKRDVRDALRELQEKNVEPIIVQMMEPILRVLDPEADGFIQLEAGPVSKAFGFVDDEGKPLAGKMNLWLALNRLIQQIPARVNDPRTLLREGVRPKDSMPADETGQYDPNAISLEEIEEQEKWAAEQYKEQGKTPRIHAEEE